MNENPNHPFPPLDEPMHVYECNFCGEETTDIHPYKGYLLCYFCYHNPELSEPVPTTLRT